MATLNQLKTKANGKLVEFWDALSIRQEAFFQKHGTYFQLLATQPVVDGVDTTFELINSVGETRTVDVQFSFNSPIPFQVSVSPWGDTHGHGYTMRAVVELPDGRRFERSRTLTDVRSKIFDVDETGVNEYLDTYVWSTEEPIISTSTWSEIIPDNL